MRIRTLILVLAPFLAAGTAFSAERASVHVVQPGQKLASIAKRYGMSIDDLCQANGLRKSAKIHPGQRLTIPGPDSDVAVNMGSPAAPIESVASTRDRVTGPQASRHATLAASSVRYEMAPRRRGLVRVLGYHGEWQGQLVDRRSHIVAKSAASVSRILAWPHKDFRMSDRLLTLLADVSDHFGGKPLRVVSGYRTTSWVEESKHPLGRACDFIVLGVPNTVLRDYLKTLENVGVGYYPNSTFVHLDVRERNTYWVDYAGPGEPPRLTPTAVIPKDPSASAELQAKLDTSSDAEIDVTPASEVNTGSDEPAKPSSYALRPTSSASESTQ